MNPILGRILKFALSFIPLFAIFFMAYITLADYYEPFAVGSANLVTRHLDPPTHLKIKEDGGWSGYVFKPEHGIQRLKSWKITTRHLILLSLVSVPSLLLATPAAWRVRFRWFLISIPLIYLGHVLAAVVLTRGHYCLTQTPGTLVCAWAKTFAVTSGQMMAGVLWFGLTWRFWFERKDASVANPPGAMDTEEPKKKS